MARGIRSLFKARDKPNDRTALNKVSEALSFLFGRSNAGQYVNERTALQTSVVYACVRVIAETIASLPIHLYEYRGEEKGMQKAIGHPLYFLLHDEPNAEMTSFVFRETLVTHLLLWGNAYAQILRNGRGHVVGLYPLLPDRMTVDRDKKGRLVYTYRKDGLDYTLRADEVLHIPGLGFDGIIGYSPIAVAKNAVGLSIAAEQYGSRFFANGAVPVGILTHPGHFRDEKAAAALRKSWHEAYGGSENAGRVAVLEEGMRYDKISLPNDEAQFLESRKFQVSEICRIFRVPPHMVADLEKATFSNIEHQSISFAVHTIRPWLVRIEQAMNRALLSEKEKGRFSVLVNMDGLQRGDYKSRMEGYAIGIQNGFMSPNDVRELESWNPIPKEQGGDVYQHNGNMVPLKDSGGGKEEA